MHRILVISLISLLMIGHVFADQVCFKKGKYRELYKGQYTEYTAAFCIHHPKYTIISQNCLSKKCLALSKTQVNVPIVVSPVGNPLFYRCRRQGGIPRMVEYFDSKKWVEASFCFFSDQSFISVGSYQ